MSATIQQDGVEDEFACTGDEEPQQGCNAGGDPDGEPGDAPHPRPGNGDDLGKIRSMARFLQSDEGETCEPCPPESGRADTDAGGERPVIGELDQRDDDAEPESTADVTECEAA